ncbi:MAG: glycosyltransferase family 4 protein [Ilumatobacteraceae bacterium]
MSIGVIAPPWVPVPPPVYGGTEVVVDHLARGLERAGHHVVLFTTGDSTCPVDRRSVLRDARGTCGLFTDELAHVQAAYDELDGCDLIHDHTQLGPLWSMLKGGSPPVVTTVHGSFTPELTRLYRTVSPHAAVIAISEHQRRSAPSVPVSAVIHHGIDVERVPVGRGRGGYVLFLGRMSPTKGVHRAMAVARRAGKKLLIAAKMWQPEEVEYFRERVEPHLGADAVYIGEVGGRAKFDLLAKAEALLNPIRWPEPFGLVMIEALATGTPVVAFPEGAAPEIVDHGLTGFLCRDEDEMVERLRQIDTIDRRECRRTAEQRFSADRMVADHVALYRRIVNGASRLQRFDLGRAG